MKTALITGGAGFIGSSLARRLLGEGWRVHIVDNLSTGLKSNIPKESEFSLLDISNEKFITCLPNDHFDVIFHLAAQSSGEISFDDPAYDFKTNCLSTLMLLDWCYSRKIKRFIYTSSMSVYGEQEIQPVKEDFLARPKSFYGVGKLASEGYLNIYSKMGLDTTALRLFNVYGPNQNMKNLRQGMVSIYMAYILNKEEILVKGSADRYRDFIYIDDVINTYVDCVHNKETFGKVYNVGSGEKTRVHELLVKELKAFGCDPSDYPIKYKGTTPGDTFGIYADITAVKKDLNWQPQVSLDKGLAEMAKWALSDKDIIKETKKG